jgi:ribosomal protein S18 acetylase RimI-like enzyme
MFAVTSNIADTVHVRVEFAPAVLPDDLRRLMAFDRRVFPKADLFDADYWRQCESWWLLVEGVRAGCCAFERNTDVTATGERTRPGCAYVATTGILPRFQGRGLGRLMKDWQIAWAMHNALRRLVGVTRKSNKAMIRLNRSCGFREVRTIPDYYADEAGIVMAIKLR